MNALAAFTVGIALEEQPENITEGLSRYEGMKGRFGIVQLQRNMVLVDDTYNANPSSLKAALETVRSLRKEGGRLIVGLGDMLELGDVAVQGAQECGRTGSGGRRCMVFCLGRACPGHGAGSN